MSKKVAILTKDKYLYQRLALELCEAGFLCVEGKKADIILCDVDTMPVRSGDITMSRREEADIKLPARLGEIPSMLSDTRDARLTLSDERTALLSGRQIHLTEIEYSLLSFLVEKREFASREEILEQVWNNEADSGVVNVYIHYLREKLESGGERVIISSRREGYRIREDLLGEVTE